MDRIVLMPSQAKVLKGGTIIGWNEWKMQIDEEYLIDEPLVNRDLGQERAMDKLWQEFGEKMRLYEY